MFGEIVYENDDVVVTVSAFGRPQQTSPRRGWGDGIWGHGRWGDITR